MKRTFLAAALLMVTAAVVLADIARPERPSGRVERPRSSVMSQMTIKLDRTASEAKLVIPRNQLKELRAELDAIDDPANSSIAGFQRTQMIVSGSLISLAFVFGGLWFVRSGCGSAKTRTTAALMAFSIASASMATIVYANVGPPPEARTINGKMFSDSVHRYKFGSGRVRLELSDADEIVFIVPDQKPSTAGEE